MSYLYLVMSGILFGGVVFGAKVLYLMGASLFEVLFYPNLISVLLVWGFARRDFVIIFKMPWRITAVYVLSVTAIVFGQAAPLFLDVPVTRVVLLIYLQPVWTILIEHFYYRRPVPARNWYLVGAMVAGLILLINPFGEKDIHFSWLGVGLALLGGIGMSLWILVTQYFSRHNIKPAATYFCTCFYAAVPVFFLWLVAKDYITAAPEASAILGMEPGNRLWLALLLYSILIYTPANTLVFYGNRNVSPATVGMILLLEPVTGISLDIAFLGMTLTWNIIVGGIIILLSNLVLILKK